MPQFYGYYEAMDKKGEGTKADGYGEGYLSPILLLEDCGDPIVVEKLSKDDLCILSIPSILLFSLFNLSFTEKNVLHCSIAFTTPGGPTGRSIRVIF